MYLLFDIGGTQTRIGISRTGDTIDASKTIPTTNTFESGIENIAAIARELSGSEKIEQAIGGIAGPLDQTHSMLISSPKKNLIDWGGKPLQKRLSEVVNAPIRLENDAALGALGEATAGAGKGAEIVVYLTVSTGVGGSRIVHRAIDPSAFGFEPGHQIIDPTGTLCTDCGDTPGTLENRVSGTALAHRFGKPAKEISDPAVWEELSLWLAYGVSNTILHWSPHVLVLGGSMITGDPAIPLDRVSYHLRQIVQVFPELPSIKKAELTDSGLWGALELITSLK